MDMIVRFFNRGGHDSGSGNCAATPGQNIEVTEKHAAVLVTDDNSLDKLRSPYGLVAHYFDCQCEVCKR